MSTHIYVQREPERQYYLAPSGAKCLAGLVTTDMRAYGCYIAAIEALILVMTELEKMLNWRRLQMSNIRHDIADLLALTHYLLRWPLKEAYKYMDTFILQHLQTPSRLSKSSIEEIKQQLTHRHKGYKQKWMKLLNMTIKAERDLYSLHNVPSIRQKVTQFQDWDDQDVPDIPALGAVELLLRVVAEAKGSDLIADVHNAFKHSKLSGTKSGDKGVHRVAIICTRTKTDGQDHKPQIPYHVIATTADCWDGFDTMSNFFKIARSSRRNTSPFRRDEDVARIIQKSEELKKKHSLPSGNCSSNSSSLRESFNHQAIYVRPLRCPALSLTPRCLRCQTLFNFSIEDDSIEDDSIEDDLTRIEAEYCKNPGATVNVNLNCAETFAHFYCKAYFNSGEFCTRSYDALAINKNL